MSARRTGGIKGAGTLDPGPRCRLPAPPSAGGGTENPLHPPPLSACPPKGELTRVWGQASGKERRRPISYMAQAARGEGTVRGDGEGNGLVP